jgi:hypothetical protein
LTGAVQETAEADDGAEWYLQPAATIRDGDPQVTLSGPDERVTYVGRYLRSGPTELFLADGRHTRLLVDGGTRAWDWDDRFMRCIDAGREDPVIARWVPHWTPAAPEGMLPPAPHVDWLVPEPGMLEVAGTDRDGRVCWSEFDAPNPAERSSRSATAVHPDGYRSVCLVGRGAVAAVTNRNEVHWLRVKGTTLRLVAITGLAVPARVAVLIHRPMDDEVIAILVDGSAVRLPRPRDSLPLGNSDRSWDA